MHSGLCVVLLFVLAAAAPITATAEPSVAASSFSAAYWGEMILHPGLRFGWERRFLGTERHALVGGAVLGGYFHFRNHLALAVSLEGGYRFTTSSTFHLELLGGLGYLHTFVHGAVYTPQGERFEKVIDLGRPHVMPVLALGGGWHGAGWLLPAGRRFVRLQFFGQYPFDGFLLPHLAVEIGFAPEAV